MANSSIYAAFERMWEHIINKFDNQTAEQVGALPITGGVMEDTLTVNGIILTEGVDYGSGEPTGGVVGQLYFKKVT